MIHKKLIEELGIQEIMRTKCKKVQKFECGFCGRFYTRRYGLKEIGLEFYFNFLILFYNFTILKFSGWKMYDFFCRFWSFSIICNSSIFTIFFSIFSVFFQFMGFFSVYRICFNLWDYFQLWDFFQSMGFFSIYGILFNLWDFFQFMGFFSIYGIFFSWWDFFQFMVGFCDVFGSL